MSKKSMKVFFVNAMQKDLVEMACRILVNILSSKSQSFLNKIDVVGRI